METRILLKDLSPVEQIHLRVHNQRCPILPLERHHLIMRQVGVLEEVPMVEELAQMIALSN